MIPITIEQVLRDRLLTQAAVTALVGTGDAARIRPGELDQSDALPAVTIECDDEVRDPDLSGGAGWIEAVISITSHAKTYVKARELHHAIAYNASDPSTGLSNATHADWSASLMGARRRLVALNDGSGGKRSAIRARYRVVYKEPR